jgi:hypothetical protein
MTAKKTTGEMAETWSLEFQQGVSFTGLAKKYGVSRSTIAGAIHRLRNKGQDVPRRVRPPTMPKKKAEQLPPEVAPPPPAPPKEPDSVPDFTEKLLDGVTILELEVGMCKFPITADRPFKFCGLPTPLNGLGHAVYCREHHALCHREDVRRISLSRREMGR